MIPSTLCWLALNVSLPLHHTEVTALEKRGTKRRTKTARLNKLAHAATPIRANSNGLLYKASKGSIAFETQKSRVCHCHQISVILAAAHLKSVNLRKTHRAIIGPDCDRVSKIIALFLSRLRNESAAHLSLKYRLKADIDDNARP
jgi:hypothetical protein